MNTFVVFMIFNILGLWATTINGSSILSNEQDQLHFSTLEFDPFADVNLTELSVAIQKDHPHAHLNVVELVQLYKYRIESHKVHTNDGYILQMHRITGNQKNPSPKGKPAVLVQHGLVCSSIDWVIAGPGKSLGFILADAGYDVWLSNARGNKYSRTHQYLTVKDPKYWSFSWHEIGVKDLPAIIDHILEVTKHAKLFYIGHSQGTTSFFVMASELPQYNEKIHAMFALAPISYSSKMYSPIFQTLSRMVKPLNLLASLLGIHEVEPTNQFFKKFSSKLCQENAPTQVLCMNLLFMIAGFNKAQLDPALLPAILAHVPAGSAVNQFVHYAQIIRSGSFHQLDLGLSGNLLKYHRITPPPYEIKNIRAPVALHYSANDWLSAQVDVEKLYSQLPNPIGKFLVSDKKFNHLDYLFAKDGRSLLYNKIVSLMSRYKD